MAGETHFDIAVVGAGIVGLAHALAAARLGLKVVVIDRDAQANGASIRNFGFITVSGQERGTVWPRAMRSRDVWREIAGPAGIEVIHENTMVVARRPEALAVVEAFMATEMGEGCSLLTREQIAEKQPQLDHANFAGALWSPHEIRVESKDAIPRVAAYLADRYGVEFRRQTAVIGIEPPAVKTSRGKITADKIVVCPGDDFATLYPERIATYNVTRCKLHMLRLADPGYRYGSAFMSDLGLARYAGYADLPEAKVLKTRLETEQGEALDNGVHLIAVQSADGSLVVGDSHHYAPTPDPFAPEHVDEIILDEYRNIFAGPTPKAIARWTGTYASASDRTMFTDAPHADVRLVVITGGTGASTSFAIAEETIAEMTGVGIDRLRGKA